MSSTIYKLNRRSADSLQTVAGQLKNKMMAQGIFGGAELVMEDSQSLGDAEAALLVFEKLYLRNGSYSNLTVQLTACDYLQRAVIIGSGGGEGFLNISLGANSNFAGKACEALKELGFDYENQ